MDPGYHIATAKTAETGIPANLNDLGPEVVLA